jgi:hypothetical protein
MDFWDVYEKERTKPNFGSVRQYLTSRERIHLSLSSVEQYGVGMEMNTGSFRKFREEERYLIVSDMTRDLFVSIYDVNQQHALLLRFSESLEADALKRIDQEIKNMKKPNLEMRVIGLQDKETELLGTVERLHGMFKSSLMEVDLFGEETRHIVFDMKLGMSFNLLLLNRIYKQYELLNMTTKPAFEKRKSEIKFV